MTLNLTAERAHKEYKDSNIFTSGKHRLLKSAAILGANASGKSNLIKAIKFYEFFINQSFQINANSEIPFDPFMICDSPEKTSFFESSFIIDEIKYRYGFEINAEKVVSEYLYFSKAYKEQLLFERTNQDISVKHKSFNEGKGLESKTRENALFISTIAQFNGNISTTIIQYFGGQLNTINGISDRELQEFTLTSIKDKNFKNKVLEILQSSDLGINDILVEEKRIDIGAIPADLRKILKIESENNIKGKSIQFQREIPNSNNTPKYVGLDFNHNESEGTKKLFHMLGPIIDTLQNGRVLIIDELDSRFHHLITKKIVSLFNSELNKKNAQLIFTTHDSNLLEGCRLRRDQIYFVEKKQNMSSDLYSLSDFKTTRVRKDYNHRKQYLIGRYGGIPDIDLQKIEFAQNE